MSAALKYRVERTESDPPLPPPPAGGQPDLSCAVSADTATPRAHSPPWKLRHTLAVIVCTAVVGYIESLAIGCVVRWHQARDEVRSCSSCEIAVSPRWTGEIILANHRRAGATGDVRLDLSEFLESVRLKDWRTAWRKWRAIEDHERVLRRCRGGDGAVMKSAEPFTPEWYAEYEGCSTASVPTKVTQYVSAPGLDIDRAGVPPGKRRTGSGNE